MNSSIALRSAILLILSGSTPAVWAAEPAQGQLEEIVVTATKRVEKLQDIPISVSAVTGDDLDRRGIRSQEEALQGQAGMLMVEGGQPVNRNVTIRGVSDGFGGLTQSTVAIYIDDMPTTVAQSNGNIGLALYDIQNVTVIRGPRSTLYGAASLGGTVKIETRNPSLDKFEGDVGVSGWSTEEAGGTSSDIHGTIAVPLSPGKASLGLTAYRNHQAGFVDSARLGEDINGSTTSGGRVTLNMQPTEAFSAIAKFYYQDADGDSASVFDPAQSGLHAPPAQLMLQPWTDKVRAGTLTLNYSTESFDVTSATSYLDKKATYVSDISSFFGPLLGFPSGTKIAVYGEFNSKVLAEELRIASVLSATGLNWSVGAFYSDEDTDNNATTPSVIGELFGSNSNFRNKQKAIFGEVGYKWDSGLAATAGIRYTQYDSHHKVNLLGLFALPIPVDLKFDESPVTPHLALSYATGGQLYYVQASKGFRLGKANFPVIPAPGITVPTYASSDSLWTYEVGAKTEWLDRRMSLNAAVYYTDWKNPQMTLQLPTGFTYIDSLENRNPGAGVEIIGGEVELVARPVPALALSAGFGYTDSTITQNVVGLDPLGGVTPSGTQLAAIPKVTANAAIRYEFPVGGARGNVGAEVQHVGGYATGYGPTSVDAGDFTSINLRAGADIGGWTVSLFATNVGNERPELTHIAYGPLVYSSTIRPRSYGLSVDYRF